MKYFATKLVSMAAIMIIVACSDPIMNSVWKINEINIDGSKKDWDGALNYYNDEKVAIGIQNDNDNIYFCLTTSDKNKIMKIFRSGLTVWFDPINSDGETIGIQFPIKKQIPRVGGQKNSENNRNEDKRINLMIEQMINHQNEILVVNEDEFPLNSYPLKNKTGLETRINFEMQQLVYELKVPLANNNLTNFYIDVLPNELVKVGFESGEMEKTERKRSGGSRRVEGMSENRGGRGGMRGGRSGNGEKMQNIMEPIEFWMEVKLASVQN